MAVGTVMLADTHVHLHPCFDLDRALQAAMDHFNRVPSPRQATAPARLLCLTDIQGQHTDSDLCDRPPPGSRWRFSRHSDGLSVSARGPDDAKVDLIPGRQIVSVENLELLALNCQVEVADGAETLDTLVDRVKAAGGTPVVPWGFGKWSGRRGAVVRGLMERRRDFYLADNGNRLRGTSEPSLLSEGRRSNFPVLMGSDPLPFRSQARRVGSSGIVLNLEADLGSPSKAFRLAMDQPARWQEYRHLASLVEFVFSQVKMQLRKRLGIDL